MGKTTLQQQIYYCHLGFFLQKLYSGFLTGQFFQIKNKPISESFPCNNNFKCKKTISVLTQRHVNTRQIITDLRAYLQNIVFPPGTGQDVVVNWVNVQALPADVRSTDKSVNKNKIQLASIIKETSPHLQPLEKKTAIYLSTKVTQTESFPCFRYIGTFSK